MDTARLMSRGRGLAPLGLILACYLLYISLWLWGGWKFLNPDGVSYIDIGREYAAGHFTEAVNTYWSPLLSWQIGVGVWIGLSGLLAAKLWMLISGAVCLCTVWVVGGMLRLGRLLRLLLGLSLAPTIGYWAMGNVTPDLLEAALILAASAALWQAVERRSVRWGVITGAVAAAGFLTKSFFFYFFILLLAALGGWLFFTDKKLFGETRRALAACAGVFLLLCLPWIATVSAKAHRPTLGTASAYNFALVGPHSTGHPILTEGLLKPARFAFATSAWDDPGRTTGTRWNPLLRNRRYEADRFLVGLGTAGQELLDFSAPLALLVVLGLLLQPRRIVSFPTTLLATAILVAALYSLVFVEPRYIWGVFLIAALLGYTTLQFLVDKRLLRPGAAMIVAVAVYLTSFLSGDIRNPLQYAPPQAYQSVAAALKRAGCSHRTVASDSDWQDSNSAAFAVHAKYDGLLQIGNTAQVAAQMDAFKPDCLIGWGKDPKRADPLLGYDRVAYAYPAAVAIYRRH